MNTIIVLYDDWVVDGLYVCMTVTYIRMGVVYVYSCVVLSFVPRPSSMLSRVFLVHVFCLVLSVL